MSLEIASDDPRRHDVRALLEVHLAFSRASTPIGYAFALDSEALLEPTGSFFSARRDGALLGIGALQQLDPTHGELKSMHTSVSARRQGVGRALVAHLLDVARDREYLRVSLETGTTNAFAPARSLYASLGFGPCEPFAGYVASPYNTFTCRPPTPFRFTEREVI